VPPLNSDIDRLETVEGFFASTRASIQHGGYSAFYSPDRVVQMCRRFALAKATTPPSPMK
jgi:antirestriction protein ArdC